MILNRLSQLKKSKKRRSKVSVMKISDLEYAQDLYYISGGDIEFIVNCAAEGGGVSTYRTSCYDIISAILENDTAAREDLIYPFLSEYMSDYLSEYMSEYFSGYISEYLFSYVDEANYTLSESSLLAYGDSCISYVTGTDFCDQLSSFISDIISDNFSDYMSAYANNMDLTSSGSFVVESYGSFMKFDGSIGLLAFNDIYYNCPETISDSTKLAVISDDALSIGEKPLWQLTVGDLVSYIKDQL